MRKSIGRKRNRWKWTSVVSSLVVITGSWVFLPWIVPADRCRAVLSFLTVKHGMSVPFNLSTGTERAYGPGINADGLANTQVGGTDCGCAPPGSRTSYRFRATGSVLKSIRIFVQDGKGYGSGTGGSMRVDLQTDDDTPNHFPSGKSIASVSLKPGNPVSDHFPLLQFAEPVALTAGRLYHLVFTNTDLAPSVNFQSVNALYMSVPLTPRQPRYSDLDWAQLLNTGRGWSVRPEYTPVLQLNYAVTAPEGIGYIEAWPDMPKRISATSAVRETFTISGADERIDGFAIRLKRLGGDGVLKATVQEADTILAQASLAASSVPMTLGWVRFAFPAPASLHSGKRYSMVLNASGDAAFATFPIRQGTSYGFSPATVFGDGFAEFRDGSDWKLWGGEGHRAGKETNLQFYFLVDEVLGSGQRSGPEVTGH
jgi:hypothetical protein